MSNIDLSQLITVEDKTAIAHEVAIGVAKAECRRRIVAVADETAQMNMSAACAAGLLSAEQLAAYQAGLAWVAAMRAAWSTIVTNALDPADDANWPAVPAGVAELADAF